jgi:adenine phosphoribosyltransferase
MAVGNQTLPAPWPFRVAGRRRAQLGTSLDGRYGAMDMARLEQAIATLVRSVEDRDLNYVIGIPEGGLVPAYAFARQAGLRPVFATSYRPADAPFLVFQEEHDDALGARYLYGLQPVDRVVIVEDEVTSGRTAVNCVRALLAAHSIEVMAATVFSGDLMQSLWQQP